VSEEFLERFDARIVGDWNIVIFWQDFPIATLNAETSIRFKHPDSCSLLFGKETSAKNLDRIANEKPLVDQRNVFVKEVLVV